MSAYPAAADCVADLSNGAILSPAGAGLVLAEWSAPGCPLGTIPERIAPLHLHRGDDEAWYVLSGTLAIQVGDEVVTAPAGTAVTVPAGTPHTYWNPEPGEARYLIVMTTRIHALINTIHASEQRDPESMKALFARFDSEWLE